jgi:plastocyanin
MAHRLRALALALPLALGLTACGGDDAAPATAPATADVVVTAKDIHFTEDAYTAPAGDIEVAYLNEDSVRHTLIILDDQNEPIPDFKLEIPGKGSVDSGTVTLDPGTYTLFCDVPGHGSMTATLTVT